jgi:hypothetical protein
MGRPLRLLVLYLCFPGRPTRSDGRGYTSAVWRLWFGEEEIHMDADAISEAWGRN